MVDITLLTLGITNCYLIKGRNGYILVDAGSLYKGKKFLKKLRMLDINPQDISLIIITHGHYDHVGSLASIKRATQAKVAMTPFENKIVAQGKVVIPKGTNVMGQIVSILGKVFSFLFKFEQVAADYLITEEFPLDDFNIEGKIVLTPGHTEGSLSVILDDGRALVGDLAMNKPIGNIFPLFADFPNQIYSSWDKLIEWGVEKVYPAHGAVFSIDLIKEGLDRRK